MRRLDVEFEPIAVFMLLMAIVCATVIVFHKNVPSQVTSRSFGHSVRVSCEDEHEPVVHKVVGTDTAVEITCEVKP